MMNPKGFCFSMGPGVLIGVSKRLWREEEGRDLAEHGLLSFHAGMPAVAALRCVASAVSAMFGSAGTRPTAPS